MTEKKSKSMIQRRLIPTYIFLTIVSFISVFPLYWMISAATEYINRSVERKITSWNTFYGELQQPCITAAFVAFAWELFSLCHPDNCDLSVNLFYRRIWI